MGTEGRKEGMTKGRGEVKPGGGHSGGGHSSGRWERAGESSQGIFAATSPDVPKVGLRGAVSVAVSVWLSPWLCLRCCLYGTLHCSTSDVLSLRWVCVLTGSGVGYSPGVWLHRREQCSRYRPRYPSGGRSWRSYVGRRVSDYYHIWTYVL